VAEFLVDANATQAAIRAGYSEKTAGPVAHKLLKNAQIFAAIEKRRGKIQNKLEITAEMVLTEYRRLGTADIRRFVTVKDGEVKLKPSAEWSDDDAAAVSEVSIDAQGNVKFKLHNKVQALDALAKHLGLAVNKHEVTNMTPMQTNEAQDRMFALLEQYKKRKSEE
jgi:phage terminase small subunit